MPEFTGRLRTPRLAAAPAAPVKGEMYYDTVSDKLLWWNGTTWIDSSGGGGAPPEVGVGPNQPTGSEVLWIDTDDPSWPGPPLYVTALPSTPTDGQEIYYQSAAMDTLGIAWHLRYRAASASAYKWEFVGGTRLSFVSGTGNHDTSSTAFAQVNAYALTLPLAGDYEVEIQANGYCNTVNQVGVVSYAVASQTAANDVFGVYVGANNTNGNSNSATYSPINASIAGRQLSIQSRTSGGTTRIYWFRLYAIPIRVG